MSGDGDGDGEVDAEPLTMEDAVEPPSFQPSPSREKVQEDEPLSFQPSPSREKEPEGREEPHLQSLSETEKGATEEPRPGRGDATRHPYDAREMDRVRGEVSTGATLPVEKVGVRMPDLPAALLAESTADLDTVGQASASEPAQAPRGAEQFGQVASAEMPQIGVEEAAEITSAEARRREGTAAPPTPTGPEPTDAFVEEARPRSAEAPRAEVGPAPWLTPDGPATERAASFVAGEAELESASPNRVAAGEASTTSAEATTEVEAVRGEAPLQEWPVAGESPTSDSQSDRPPQVEERVARQPIQSPPASPRPPLDAQRRSSQRQESLAEPAASAEADALFQPIGTDRSPRAWAARIRQMLGIESKAETEETAAESTIGAEASRGAEIPSVAEAQSEYEASVPPGALDSAADATAPSPPPASEGRALRASSRVPERVAFSESTRRFLRPLVGVDLGEVRVHQGSTADRIVSTFQADAIAVGEDVVLRPGESDETPEALGLLAHELTHVARQREPRFVPPMLASANEENVSSVTQADDEALAQTMERRVARVARAREARATSARPRSQTPSGDVTATDADGLDHPPSERRMTPDVGGTETPGDSYWGNLPAPWEPMPSLPTSTAAESVSVTAPVAASTGFSSVGAASPVQTALEGRESSTSQEPGSTSSSSDGQRAPEPDLDALARQVYGILKRRLAVERRRQAL